MNATVERWYPFVGGALVGVALSLSGVIKNLHDGPTQTLMGHGINVAAIAVGFLATAQSVLVSIERSRVVELMRESGYYEDLLDYLLDSVKLWFVVAFASALLVLTVPSLREPWRSLALSGWFGLVAWAALAGYRVIAFLGAVLRRTQKP